MEPINSLLAGLNFGAQIQTSDKLAELLRSGSALCPNRQEVPGAVVRQYLDHPYWTGHSSIVITRRHYNCLPYLVKEDKTFSTLLTVTPCETWSMIGTAVRRPRGAVSRPRRENRSASSISQFAYLAQWKKSSIYQDVIDEIFVSILTSKRPQIRFQPETNTARRIYLL